MPPKQCKCKSLWKSLKVPQYQRTVQYATWELQMQIIKSTRVPTNQCRCHHSALGAWSNIVPAVSYRSKEYKYKYNANAYDVVLFNKCKYKYNANANDYENHWKSKSSYCIRAAQILAKTIHSISVAKKFCIWWWREEYFCWLPLPLSLDQRGQMSYSDWQKGLEGSVWPPVDHRHHHHNHHCDNHSLASSP